MSKRYPPGQRARAVKMVLDRLDEYRSVYAACQAIGPKVGVGVESLRQWTVQAQIDAQQAPGPDLDRTMDAPVRRRDAGSTKLCAAVSVALAGSGRGRRPAGPAAARAAGSGVRRSTTPSR
jgi:transposase-like protein